MPSPLPANRNEGSSSQSSRQMGTPRVSLIQSWYNSGSDRDGRPGTRHRTRPYGTLPLYGAGARHRRTARLACRDQQQHAGVLQERHRCGFGCGEGCPILRSCPCAKSETSGLPRRRSGTSPGTRRRPSSTSSWRYSPASCSGTGTSRSTPSDATFPAASTRCLRPPTCRSSRPRWPGCRERSPVPPLFERKPAPAAEPREPLPNGVPVRWSRPVGQFGGWVKLGSGCRHAASLCPTPIPYASSGVRPAKVEWGRRML